MKSQRQEIADGADIIVSGIAFTKKDEYIYAVNLHNTQYRAKFSMNKKLISSNMSDESIRNIINILTNNMEFLR